jgi:hypothetical protein
MAETTSPISPSAIGTQTEAIVVRGLSLSRLSLRHLLADELLTGVLIGIVHPREHRGQHLVTDTTLRNDRC